MGRMARISALAGVSAVLATSAVAGAGAASAATSFDVSSGVSRVTGALSFNGTRSFTGTNVTLYDTSCDSRSAQFRFVTNNGAYGWHTVNQCNTHATWSSLTGTDGGNISWVRVETKACNGGSCSSSGAQTIDNPNT